MNELLEELLFDRADSAREDILTSALKAIYEAAYYGPVAPQQIIQCLREAMDHNPK